MSRTLERELNATIGHLMEHTGKTDQRELADAMEVSQPRVSARRSGKGKWQINDLPQVANYFGVTVCALLMGWDEMGAAGLRPPAKDTAGQTRI